MTDVLVVGAGPAGSAAALTLARAGYEVLLVDRCRFPRMKACGEYFNPECARLLRELGVMPELLAAGARTIPALSLGRQGETALVAPFAEVAPGAEPAFSIGREVLDTVLVRRAQAEGVTLWEEALVREPLVEGGRVIGAIIRVNGVEREVRARLTLAADGLRSRFARRLKLGRPTGRRKKLGLTARFDVAPGAADALEMHAGWPGCCGLALRGGEANIGLVADMEQAREIGGDPAAFITRALAEFPRLATRVEGPPRGVKTVGPLTWTTGRQSMAGCLLLGDAAGFYDPFTGQGVTFALLGAALAAEVGAASLAEDDLSARRLAEYSRRRHAMLAPRILVQKAIQAVVERPVLYDHILHRLAYRPAVARTLVGIVADLTPASHALSPRFLTGLVA
jgi:flavin-dependent dehydrogenase